MSVGSTGRPEQRAGNSAAEYFERTTFVFPNFPTILFGFRVPCAVLEGLGVLRVVDVPPDEESACFFLRVNSTPSPQGFSRMPLY